MIFTKKALNHHPNFSLLVIGDFAECWKIQPSNTSPQVINYYCQAQLQGLKCLAMLENMK